MYHRYCKGTRGRGLREYRNSKYKDSTYKDKYKRENNDLYVLDINDSSDVCAVLLYWTNWIGGGMCIV